MECNERTNEQQQSSVFSTRNQWLAPKIAFLLVAFSLGELGDGLNIFQGIYLVGIGWNEGSVGLALSLMGLTALIVQTFAGDFVDKTRIDRRIFLAAASIVTALSASAILFVREGNQDHMLIFVSKVIEGVSASFIGPCLAALTLANFGPHHFDTIMASNILWGHIGTLAAAVLAGIVAYVYYPDSKYCFLVIGASALVAVLFVQYLPQGDQLMGRGFEGKLAMDEAGHLEKLGEADSSSSSNCADSASKEKEGQANAEESHSPPQAASYWDVLADKKSVLLCLTGFFFHFANANVLLVLGELMSVSDEDGTQKRSAIPLTAGAIVLAQLTMAIATWAGDRLTLLGTGRKPLFLAGLASLPIRCALIIFWKDAGDAFLLSTQILDGLGGGLCGLVHPYLVADITFGTGRFNVVMGLTASFFGLGATLSNFLGQVVVEKLGHVASLSASLCISFVPVLIFGLFMPETLGQRGAAHPHACSRHVPAKEEESDQEMGAGGGDYRELA